MANNEMNTEELEAQAQMQAENSEQNPPVVDEGGAEAALPTTGENSASETSRDRIIKRLQGKYPDKTYDDDEGIYNDVDSDLNEMDTELTKYRDADTELSTILEENPELYSIIEDLKKKVPLKVALAKVFGPEDLEMAENEENYQMFEDERQKRTEKLKAQKEYEEQLSKNVEESAPAIKKFFEDHGLEGESRTAFGQFIDDTFNDVLDGKFTDQLLAKLWKAYSYDKDVDDALETGEIAGRNAQIDAERERQEMHNDGIPSSGNSFTPSEMNEEEDDDIFAEIARAKRKRFNH